MRAPHTSHTNAALGGGGRAAAPGAGELGGGWGGARLRLRAVARTAPRSAESLAPAPSPLTLPVCCACPVSTPVRSSWATRVPKTPRSTTRRCCRLRAWPRRRTLSSTSARCVPASPACCGPVASAGVDAVAGGLTCCAPRCRSRSVLRTCTPPRRRRRRCGARQRRCALRPSDAVCGLKSRVRDGRRS